MATPSVSASVQGVPTRHGDTRGLQEDRERHAEKRLRGPDSPQFQGRFGRMFSERELRPARFTAAALKKLAAKMTAQPDRPKSEEEVDDDENTGISAGYTYLSQFIDHDLTFDPESSLQQQDDPYALVDYRTPRFDLDCLYGRGPRDQPYLYRSDQKHFILGEQLIGNDFDKYPRDLPRNRPTVGERARAIIGDPRNDENVVVSQLHASMQRFHNRMVDLLGERATFEQAQELVRWHYQWVVLYDFLPTIIGERTWKSILPHIDKKATVREAPPRLRFYKWRKWQKNIFMPVEFAVAAYRFGHSMVRPVYRLNTRVPRRNLSELLLFESLTNDHAVDWRLFFDFDHRTTLDQPLPRQFGPERVQLAYKIDTSLASPLAHLPPKVVAKAPFSLAQRNLDRGLRMSLPSGQAVAKHMGHKPIADDELWVGKACQAHVPNRQILADLSPQFKNKAPLWFYILAEAQRAFKTDDTPIRLGPVGGRIVGEVIVGLLMADRKSFLRKSPGFRPFAFPLSHEVNSFKRETTDDFRIPDLLRQAALAET